MSKFLAAIFIIFPIFVLSLNGCAAKNQTRSAGGNLGGEPTTIAPAQNTWSNSNYPQMIQNQVPRAQQYIADHPHISGGHR